MSLSWQKIMSKKSKSYHQRNITFYERGNNDKANGTTKDNNNYKRMRMGMQSIYKSDLITKGKEIIA